MEDLVVPAGLAAAVSLGFDELSTGQAITHTLAAFTPWYAISYFTVPIETPHELTEAARSPVYETFTEALEASLAVFIGLHISEYVLDKDLNNTLPLTVGALYGATKGISMAIRGKGYLLRETLERDFRPRSQ